jgi:hypothetical protein
MDRDIEVFSTRISAGPFSAVFPLLAGAATGPLQATANPTKTTQSADIEIPKYLFIIIFPDSADPILSCISKTILQAAPDSNFSLDK